MFRCINYFSIIVRRSTIYVPMDTVKVETEEYLEHHVNKEKLPSNIQLAVLKPKKEYEFHKDECFSYSDQVKTEIEFDNAVNDAEKECLSETFKYDPNSINHNQYLNELKQEINEQQECNDALCESEVTLDEQKNNVESCVQEEVNLKSKKRKRKKTAWVFTRRFQTNDEASNLYTVKYDNSDEDQTNSKRLSKSVECLFCNYITEDVIQLINHTKIIHQQFICGLCKFVSPLEFCLKRHMTIEHPKFNHTDFRQKSYQCNMCEFVTKNLFRIKRHVENIHLQPKPSKCNLCDFVTVTKGGIERHVNSVHLNLKIFKCDSCNFRTSAKGRLENHVNAVHLKLKNHQCHLCDFKTTIKEYLRRHLNFIHLQLNKYKCTYCKYETSRGTRLNTHINEVHLGLKQFKCHICPYQTARKSNLESHITAKHSHSHTDNCDSCKKVDKNVVANEVNVKRVVKPKKFKCPHCEFRTARTNSLREHVNAIHLKIKNFQCDLCTFATSVKRRLIGHVAAVHWKVKHHKCKFCDYMAFRKHQLDLHVVGVHLKGNK